jgi:hypothetical protein
MKEYVINNKKYRLNIFDSLCPETAYLIGYLAGDGGFSKETHKKKSKLYVSSNDLKTIEWMKEKFCPDSTIGSKIPINKTRNIVSTNLSYTLSFSSLFSPTFKKYGILDIKENRMCVNISKKLFKYYLRGLVDSDGHITCGRRKDRNRIYGNLGITHGSEKLLKTIQLYLETELNISSSLSLRKTEKCWDLKVASLPKLKQFCEWISEDELTPFYKKYQINKFKELLYSAT